MPRRRPSEGGSAVALGDAFQQVAQGMARLQEALQLQGQEAERRFQEALKRQEQEAERRHQEALKRQEQEAERRLNEALQMQEQRAATALRQAVAQIEVKLKEKDRRIRALQEQAKETKKKEAVGVERSKDVNEAVQQLKGRVQAVEASLEKAMQKIFPRVDGLQRQLDVTAPPGPASSIPSPTTSAANTSAETSPGGEAAGGGEENPRPSASSAPSTSSSATALGASVPEGSAGDRRGEPGASQRTGDEDTRLQRQSVELRIQEAKEKTSRMRATPSRLGENFLRAALVGNVDGIRNLLDAGADINYVGRDGSTAMMLSFKYVPCENKVALLLQRGVDVNAVNIRGETALHWSVLCYTSERFVDLIVAAGGDVNATTEDGETPLHRAAQWNNEVAVRALLSAGARRDIKGWEGKWKNKTPFDIADTPEIGALVRL